MKKKIFAAIIAAVMALTAVPVCAVEAVALSMDSEYAVTAPVTITGEGMITVQDAENWIFTSDEHESIMSNTTEGWCLGANPGRSFQLQTSGTYRVKGTWKITQKDTIEAEEETEAEG